jgi:aminoglycoside phosphotransferase (APT) family kinase protein
MAAGADLRGSSAADAELRDADLRAWLAAELGGEVVAWTPLGRGNSRRAFAADVRRGGEVLELVVRCEDGGGPVAGTELTLEREAVVYRALEGRGLPVPTVRAASPRALVLDRMPGRAGRPEAARGDYLEKLGALHRIPAAELDLPGLATTARAELDLWAGIARARVHPPAELVDRALTELRAGFPGEPDRLVLCHGDAGDGNFLHEDGRVTAMLDWEFAHLGDPHDDLAWMTVRASMYGRTIDDFADLVREHYDLPVSAARLRYWHAVVLLRNVICCESMRDDERPLYRELLRDLVPRLASALEEL